ncbi:MAG: cobyric acid synthase [Desulfobacteraceae bacterium]|nr:cobyric acid synthase [Desulfobacteraceae bacterium]
MKNESASCIAILGTGSDVGKSIVTTALCRVFSDSQIDVAPYKAQNMSNNSGVTPEGLEMGRAQIVQAEAARIAPHVDMNPVLLKPTSQVGSQVVLLGKAWLNASAVEYHNRKNKLFDTACSALDRLRKKHSIVVMEGAGSCAEVNLLPNDIVNLRMAQYANAPVILVADIHRGGVFAQIVGTLACLPEKWRSLIKGVIINRFRGDIALFKGGVQWIENHTGLPVLGVLPWYEDFAIEQEDSVVIEQVRHNTVLEKGKPAIAVIRLPHISNFTDMDPLHQIDGLQVVYLERPRPLADFSAVIIPGSKSTRSDLEWAWDTGWAEHLKTYANNGGALLGICGGYQMLGRTVQDPDGVEAKPGVTAGIDLLPVETILKAPKTTTRTLFSWNGGQGAGYEIHMGQTRRYQGDPVFNVHQRNQITCDDIDGCVTENGRIMGTYIHGLFDSPGITHKWLNAVGLGHLATDLAFGPAARDRSYDQLADHFCKHIRVEQIRCMLK